MVFRRVLVTGANGLLGQAIVTRLSGLQNYDVLATGRDADPKFEGCSCGYISLDITDTDSMHRIFVDFEPDVVVNCAAMTQVDLCETRKSECWKTNVDAVESLVKLCRVHNTKLVHVSTDFIFDGKNGPYRETDRPDPVNYYGKSKVASENAVRSLPDNLWTIVRTVLVYGHARKLTRSNIATWIISNLSEGKSINVVTDQFRSPTYVEDLARGIEKAIRYNKTGVYHISGRDQLSVYDFALKIAEVLGYDENLIHPVDASSFSQTAARPPRTGFIILKAETELGYRPMSFELALTDLESRLNASVKA
ncbi:MAG: dTDP-4-dehydrorhamnose reductase [Rhodothermales bacterium]|nr:dTDP-4-dehydrorhamnose reductase [Rhodothermales bacterium]